MVQINTPAEEDAVWGMVAGRSIPGLSFSVENPPGSGDFMSLPVGTSYTGITVEALQRRQATDYNDRNKLKFYDVAETQPIWDIIATLQTDYADPANDEDDGIRRLFFTGQMRRALQDEVRALGIKRFGVGTRITVTLTGFKPNPKGKPTKLFDVKLVPTEWVAPDQLATQEVLAAGGEQFPATAPAAPEPKPIVTEEKVGTPADLAVALALLNGPPAAPAPVITKEHMDKVATLIMANIDRDTAIKAVVAQLGESEAFRKALDTETPI